MARPARPGLRLGNVGKSIATAGAAAVLAVAGLAACGGDEDPTGPTIVPAAGEDAQVESGDATYDVSGSEWLELSSSARDEAVADFVADNPDDCSAEGREASPGTVRDYADATLGTDYPLNAPVGELLAEGCAASLQSG